jgi:four helix bundle protein
MSFRFERLQVWPKALDFADGVVDESLKWPVPMQSSLGDQVRRAAVSVVTNIAESSGKRTGKSRRLFFDHARGSIYEVIGIMSLAYKRGLLDEPVYNSFYQVGDEIAAMLWGLMEAEIRREKGKGGSDE